jgi:hypothetical protein
VASTITPASSRIQLSVGPPAESIPAASADAVVAVRHSQACWEVGLDLRASVQRAAPLALPRGSADPGRGGAAGRRTTGRSPGNEESVSFGSSVLLSTAGYLPAGAASVRQCTTTQGHGPPGTTPRRGRPSKWQTNREGRALALVACLHECAERSGDRKAILACTRMRPRHIGRGRARPSPTTSSPSALPATP